MDQQTKEELTWLSQGVSFRLRAERVDEWSQKMIDSKLLELSFFAENVSSKLIAYELSNQEFDKKRVKVDEAYKALKDALDGANIYELDVSHLRVEELAYTCHTYTDSKLDERLIFCQGIAQIEVEHACQLLAIAERAHIQSCKRKGEYDSQNDKINRYSIYALHQQDDNDARVILERVATAQATLTLCKIEQCILYREKKHKYIEYLDACRERDTIYVQHFKAIVAMCRDKESEYGAQENTIMSDEWFHRISPIHEQICKIEKESDFYERSIGLTKYDLHTHETNVVPYVLF